MFLQFQTEEKKIIGILCEYYRSLKFKENHSMSSPWRIENFLQDSFGVMVCSKRTYGRIVKGEIIADESIYEYLLKKFDRSFLWLTNLNEDIENMMKVFEEMIFKCNYEQAQSVLRRVEAVLINYTEEFYYEEIKLLIKDIRNYYLYDKYFDMRTKRKYERILYCFPTILQVLIKNMLFSYVVYYKPDFKRMNLYVEKWQMKKDTNIQIQINYFLAQKYNREALEAYHGFEIIRNELFNHKNYGRFLIVTNYQANVANVISPTRVRELEFEMLKVIKKYRDILPSKLISGYYYMVGMRNLDRKELETASDCFFQSLHYGQINRAKEINIYLAYICARKNIEYQFNTSLEYDLNTAIGKFYNYFILKDKGANVNELENYICKIIYPSLTSMELYFFEVYEYELEKLVEKSRNYKKLANFKMAKVA